MNLIIPDFDIGAEYAEKMASVTEAPESFHYAALITTVGALLGRKVWIPYSQKLYPNIFTCLVGASGLTRKTTSIRLATSMFPDMPTLKGLSSFEGLLFKMKDTPELLIILEEFSAFLLKVKRQESISSMLPKLAELYDNPDKVELPTKESPLVVNNPCISLVTATTPEWLEGSLEFADVMGGIGNRFMFVFGEVTNPVSLPRVPFYGDLPKRIEEKVGRFKGSVRLGMDSEAEEVWTYSYKKWYGEQKEQDEVRRILDVRMPALVLKVAMIIHCLEGSGKGISYKHLISALKYVESIRSYLDELRPIFSPLEMKILKVIEKAKEIRRWKLHQSLGGRVKGMDLHNAITILMKFNRIEEIGGVIKIKNE